MEVKHKGMFRKIRVDLTKGGVAPQFFLEILGVNDFEYSFSTDLDNAQMLVNLFSPGDIVSFVFDKNSKIKSIHLESQLTSFEPKKPTQANFISTNFAAAPWMRFDQKIFLAHTIFVGEKAASPALPVGYYASCYSVVTKDPKDSTSEADLVRIIFETLPLKDLLHIVNRDESVKLKVSDVVQGLTKDNKSEVIYLVSSFAK